MRNPLFAATVSTGLVVLLSSTAMAAEAPYIDNRSDPAAVVRSLYSAINRHEYARAWSYFSDPKPAKDFDTFVKGYDGTDHVEVDIGNAGEEGAAGSIYYQLPVAIRATAKDGSQAVFAGCYTLRQVNAQIQGPPFNPIHIEKGSLKPSKAPFEKALPESCGDGPPPPKKDTSLDAARAQFMLAYGGQCQDPPDGPKGEPQAYAIPYQNAESDTNQPERTMRLFRFFCSMAAYNESAVYYIDDSSGHVRQLQFTVPELDIRYANGDTQGEVESVNVIGFQTEDRLINSGYDEQARTITSDDKWRGVGDASSQGTYLLRDGHFSLVQYDVDASYDGQVDPQTVIDYNTPP
ncbi:DUF1176 domain-containing protein [Manganibacter manganicus]|uniref:DUF1176 domain-containing protein n=1 Tax=Manganibacter manganicus TaxID=1873176 RepID=A0A1V8RUC2_9HYPH|nr:DUF1176 domain-containing protein [Pseudaminobacter manganicus]OQM76619.1 DUF1176 domain-containing protein [Pseudaminobacter manganicus]